MNILINNKIKKTLKLFFGMRQAHVRDALSVYGFNQEVMEEGFRLVHAAARSRLDKDTVEVAAPRWVARLDAFENTWFPIARAVLSRSYPEVGAKLFANLKQQNGQEVAISAAIFLERLERMGNGEEPFGLDGIKARESLAERGFTAEREGEARDLVAESVLPKEPTIAVSADEQKATIDAMWAWYLEWSAIARVAIKEKRTLRSLGFGGRRTTTYDEAEELDGAIETEGAPMIEANAAEAHQLTAPLAAE